jgi:hypothetical protein
VDADTHYGNLSAYYFIDGYNLNNPYATSQGGANVPGFRLRPADQQYVRSVRHILTCGGKPYNQSWSRTRIKIMSSRWSICSPTGNSISMAIKPGLTSQISCLAFPANLFKGTRPPSGMTQAMFALLWRSADWLGMLVAPRRKEVIPFLVKATEKLCLAREPTFPQGILDHLIPGLLALGPQPRRSAESTGRNGHASLLLRRRARGLITGLAGAGLNGRGCFPFRAEACRPLPA